ncbi:MAG: adenosylmethionine decarboxylase [Myxococcota bacterium]
MESLGRHLIVEYHGCNTEVLNDLTQIEALMRLAAVQARATIVASVFHPFTPQGVSGVVVIEESHLSIHTWPETGYAAVDFYTCGDCKPERAYEVLQEGLEAQRSEVMVDQRGTYPPSPSLRVSTHYSEGSTHNVSEDTNVGGESSS